MNNYCEICNNITIETKEKQIFVCSNCFHVKNCNIIHKSEYIGQVSLLHKNNQEIILCDILHNLFNFNIFFKWLIGLNKNKIYIKVPKFDNFINYKYVHYFNINSMKFLCETYNLNIVNIYQIKEIDEIFYIFEIKTKSENSIYNNSNLYNELYNEMLNDTYLLNNYI